LQIFRKNNAKKHKTSKNQQKKPTKNAFPSRAFSFFTLFRSTSFRFAIMIDRFGVLISIWEAQRTHTILSSLIAGRV
jgi:hypothetical protein